MRRVLSRTMLLLALAGGGCGGPEPELRPAPGVGMATLQLAGRAVRVELAITQRQRQRGLMHRTHLADDEGMLFLFARAEPRTFWMKDTLVPLDIVFLDDDGTIQNVERAPPGVEKPGFSSRRPCRMVLELRQGWCAEAGLGPGDRLQIPAHLLELPAE